MPKQKTELEQYKDYCQECYEEFNSKHEPEPELELQPEVLSIQFKLPPQPQVQPEPD